MTGFNTTRRKVEMRRFRLKRMEDESGVSGTGYVAEGVQFSDGQCVISWLTETSSTGIYHSAVEMIHIHGHGGKTQIEWVDDRNGIGDPVTDPNLPLDEKIQAFEIREITAALEACNNNKRETAEKLGLSRQGLLNKLKRYGLNGHGNGSSEESVKENPKDSE